jgi:phenylpropionate dioxygenase-like ring-hydroxylating dioxygenase large terminal subunit
MRARGNAMYMVNFWYIGAWSNEITSKPKRRLLMNQPIVMFRCQDGTVSAFEDRCSHRGYPLSKGELREDKLQCGYHGLTFDRHGVCVYAPGQDRPPSGGNLIAYPVEERDGVIWIWMGSASDADKSLVPDLSWISEKGWTPFLGGYIYLKAEHTLLAENLLDISHLAFVHKSTMGSTPALMAGCELEVIPEDFGVRRITTSNNIPTPPVYRQSALVGDRIDQRIESTMRPGLYQNHVSLKNSGGGQWRGKGAEGDYPIITRSFHGIVAETDKTTHYFFGGAFKDIDVAAMNGDQARQILLEDVDVLESIEDNMTYVRDRRTINLRNDLTVMQWRSYVKKTLLSVAQLA